LKRLYSVNASTSKEVHLTYPEVLLELGPNVFTLTTADIDDVVKRLEKLGVKVRAVYCLSQPPPSEDGPQ